MGCGACKAIETDIVEVNFYESYKLGKKLGQGTFGQIAMAYGPLAQCAFMSGPSPFKKKAPPGEEKKQFKDLLPPWKPPDRCEAPPPGSFMLYCFDMEEAKDPNATSRSLPLDEMSHVTFGSSQEVDGMVYDGNKGVRPEHAAIYYMKSRWFLKAVNGPVTIESMTLHQLKDSDGKPPKRYTSASTKKMETIEPMDAKKKLTREFCVFRLGDSDRRFWIGGSQCRVAIDQMKEVCDKQVLAMQGRINLLEG
eukprot:g31055.t1